MREIKFRIKDWNGKWEEFVVLYNEQWASSLEECDSKTLSQFTGLKDRNGKEVYEGDIVLIRTTDEKIEVKWQENIDGDSQESSGFRISDAYTRDDYEVIGNIFDNPELVEGE